jgi:arylamine N-acetyltransferase
MSVGARINHRNQHDGEEGAEATYGGWSHMINLVTIRGSKYIVDVGFGAGGSTHPLPLVEGQISMNVPPNQNIRLRRDAIPEADDYTSKMWIMERRSGDSGIWTPLYCFEDNVCFLPQDFEIMNFYTSMNRTSFYTYRVVCSKYLIHEQQETVIGDVVLYDDRLVRRVRGRPGQVIQLKTEKDRVEALEKYMGITLTDAERAGIKGMVTELPEKADEDE